MGDAKVEDTVEKLRSASFVFVSESTNEASPQTDESCRGGSDRRFMTSSGINQSHWDRSTA
jgi:hypothetical protein